MVGPTLADSEFRFGYQMSINTNFTAPEEIVYRSSYGSSVTDGLSATKIKDPVTSQVAATLGTASKGARASLTSNCENTPEECWAHSVCESLKVMSVNNQSARPPTREL